MVFYEASPVSNYIGIWQRSIQFGEMPCLFVYNLTIIHNSVELRSSVRTLSRNLALSAISNSNFFNLNMLFSRLIVWYRSPLGIYLFQIISRFCRDLKMAGSSAECRWRDVRDLSEHLVFIIMSCSSYRLIFCFFFLPSRVSRREMMLNTKSTYRNSV